MDDLTRGPIQRTMSAVWSALGIAAIFGTAIALIVFGGRRGVGMHRPSKSVPPKRVERTDPFVLIAQAIESHARAVERFACAIEKLAEGCGSGGTAQDQGKIDEATARLRRAKDKLEESTEANTTQEGE